MSTDTDMDGDEVTSSMRRQFPSLFEPTPGPSRQSPSPGPSGQSQSPSPGPSRGRDKGPSQAYLPSAHHSVSSSSSSSEDFDPENINYRSKHHKRRKVEYQRLKFRGTSSSEEDSDQFRYEYSPPMQSNDDETVFLNRSFRVRLTQIQNRQNNQFNISDHLFNLSFEPLTQNNYLLRDLFEVVEKL